MASFEEFLKLDMRIGKIIEVADFPEAHNPSYKLVIDFGKEMGIKRSSAQLTAHYQKHDLEGKMIVAVVNFPPKQIGPVISEVLVLGVPDENGDTILMEPGMEGAVWGGKTLLNDKY